MTTTFAINLVEEVNAQAEPLAVLGAIDFHADKVQQAGEITKAFCPVHKDSRFRSLLVDSERRAFRCTVKTCAGYGGGSMVDLYALAGEKSVLQAACELAQRLQLPLEEGWLDNLVSSYLEEAAAASERGDFTEAENLLRELTTVTPDRLQPRVMLADLHHELGNPQEAAEEYVRIIDDALAAGKTDDAFAVADEAVKRFAQNEDVRFASVRVAEASGNQQLAIARMQEIIAFREADNRQMDNIGLLEQLAKMAPDRPEFAIKLGGLYEQQHNVRGASRQYEDAANHYATTGDTASAIQWLDKVVQFNSENTRARMQLAELLVQHNQLDKAREHTFRVINQHIDHQEFGPATEIVNSWLQHEPDSISVRELQARIFQEQERTAEAAAYLVEGADLASAAGDHNTASELLLRAKYLAPDEISLRRKLIEEFSAIGESQRAAFERIDLAEILFSSDNAADAIDILNEAVASDVSLTLKLQILNSLITRGRNDLVQEHLQALEPILQQAPPDAQADFYELKTRVTPQSAETRLHLVDTLWASSPARAVDAATEGIVALAQSGNIDGATQVLEATSARIDTYVPGTPQLLKAAAQIGRIDVASIVYQAIVQGLADDNPEMALETARWMAGINPQHPSAPSDVAFLLAALGHSSEAAAQYASVAELLLVAGDYEAGLQYAREATALDPDSITALAVHARLAHQLLPADQAQAAAQELLARLPAADTPAAAEAGYLAAAELFPEDESLLANGITALLDLGNQPAAAHLQASRAALISGRGDWSGAAEVLLNATQLAPDDPAIWEQYGEASRILTNPDTAASAFAQAGLIYASQNFHDDARRCVNSAEIVQATAPEVWAKIFEAAEAAEVESTSIAMAEALVRHHTSEGPASATVRWAREWVRLAPGTAAAHEALGRALISLNQPDKAAAALSVAARLYHQAGNDDAALTAVRYPVDVGLYTDDDAALLKNLATSETATDEQKATATVLLGGVYLQSGDVARATDLASATSSEAAAQLWPKIARTHAAGSPDAADAWTRGADALQALGRAEEAIALLREALKSGGDDTTIHATLGDLLIQQNRPGEALGHQLRVLEASAQAKPADFGRLLQKTRSVAGDNVSGLVELAQTLLQLGRRDEAVVDLEKAAEIATAANDSAALIRVCSLDEEITRSSPLLARARADALMGMENEQQALEWVQDNTRRLVSEGNYAEAVDMADRWMHLRPADIEARRHFATACQNTGRQDEADAANLETARLLLKAKGFTAAADLLQQLSARMPNDLQVLQLLIDAHRGSSNNEAAAEVICQLAQAHEVAGDLQPALAAYTQCVSIQPDNSHALLKQAQLTLQLNGDAAALPVYRQWLQARRSQVEPEQWITDLKTVLEIAPESSSTLRDLSEALLAAGRATEALPYLADQAAALELEENFAAAAQCTEQLIAHTPTPTAEHHLTAARLYQKAGMRSQSEDHLRHAARSYQEQGHPKKAATTLDRLLKAADHAPLPEDYALAALAHAKAGNKKKAAELIQTALETISATTGNADRKEKILLQALEVDPLNPDYVAQRMEQLPLSRAITEGIRAAKTMQAAGHHEQAVQVLTQVVVLVPHDMSLRQHLFEPLRAIGNKIRLRQELIALASDALSAGDSDAAIEALDEAETLAETAQQFRTLAELNERARRVNRAGELFAKAALAFADGDKTEQAVASINRAMSSRPDSISTEIMTELVRKIGSPVYDIAREQLRKALSSRKQKQSQMLALAIMAALPDRVAEVLKTVYTLGGSSILAGLSHTRVNHLLEGKHLPEALALVNLLLEIAPDSSDIWHLFAQVSNSAGNRRDAVRAALEAARLYAMAGAVIEEEEAYLQAIEADPADPTIRSTFAEFLVREHRPDEAVSHLQGAVEQAELAGNIDIQLEALNRAVQIAPANVDLREKLASLLDKIAPDSAIENWLQTANLYREAGEHDRARRALQHILAINPRNESALNQLMLAAREDADLVTAAKLASRLAEVKAARKNIGEAVRILQGHLEIDPDNLEILEQLSTFAGASNNNEVFITTTRALARKFQKLGDNAAALRHYEAVVERQPKDLGLLTTVLDCCAAAGNSEKGLTYARQLLAVARETEDPERIRIAAATILNFDESDAEARRELAESLLSLNRVQEAVTEFMRAAELFEAAGSSANAFVCYRRATQISPATAQAWRRFADLALTIGDLETARHSLSHVLETATPADVPRIRPLLDRMLQHSSDDAEVHQMALEHFRRIDDPQSASREALWLANHAANAGDNDKAEALFQEAQQGDPLNQDIKAAHYGFIKKIGRLEELQLRLRQEAEQHLVAGDNDKAADSLRELADVAPGQVGVHRDLARLLETAERHDEALQEYLTVVSLLLERSELEEAREIAESLVTRFPESTNCRELVADLLAQSAYPDLAARYYATAADAATLKSDHERAIHLLRKAVDARPLWASARSSLASAYEKAGQPDAAFNATIELVSILLENGEFMDATTTLTKLSREHPDRPEVREQLVGLYEKTGRRTEYLQVLRELAEIYDKDGDNQKALATYHRLTQADPEDAAAIQRYVDLAASQTDTSNPDSMTQEYARLADVLARSGDIEGAFQAYEQVLAQSPDNTSARSRYAAFLLARGSRNRAVNEMRTLANLYIQRAEPAAAAEVLNAAMAVSPRDAELCLELAKAQESAGLIEDARVSYSRASAILASTAAVKGIDTYRRILSIDENNTPVRLRLVELLMKTGDTMEAAREARTLAEIHISRGELAEAEHAYALVDQCEPQSIDQIREAIQRDSYDPSLQYLHYVRLGNCLFNNGDIDNALDSYRTARSLHDDQPELIQKCIDCLSLIAPEAEAIPDYLVLAEKQLLAGQMQQARQTYEKVRMIDPFNNDARCGIESVNAAENRKTATTPKQTQDDLVLKTSRGLTKRVALRDLLMACQEAANEQTTTDDSRLGLNSK